MGVWERRSGSGCGCGGVGVGVGEEGVREWEEGGGGRRREEEGESEGEWLLGFGFGFGFGFWLLAFQLSSFPHHLVLVVHLILSHLVHLFHRVPPYLTTSITNPRAFHRLTLVCVPMFLPSLRRLRRPLPQSRAAHEQQAKHH